ncbi:MAG: beta-N-acetylhexosaminidase [Lachnospiraceae bacterium]|nr:beta-N-acetylhexosaminidase [Lachnospiraceae bacterium]
MKETNETIDNLVDEQGERRSYRRKRRIRNQIIAYFVAVVLLTGIVFGINVGVRSMLEAFRNYQAANESAIEPLDEVPEEVPEEIEIVEITAPPDEEVIIIEEEPIVEISALDIYVDSQIALLSLEEKIAGLFIITPEALTGANNVTRAGETTREKLLEYPVGGLIYFRANIESARQITEMLENTRNMSKYPIFLALDEEGGEVTRLASRNIAENVGPMEDIGATNNPQLAKEAGITIGTYMSEFGFNLNFAPIADVIIDSENSPAEANPLGTRTFSPDPAVAAEMVRAFVQGAKETGVSSTLKHFPGLGNASVDTHEGMAITERTINEMQDFEFLPFIAGINEGVEFIMMGHISVPNITGDNTPASLSKKMVTEILREELGFTGIIITDALNMGAITEYYTAADAAVRALQAGADMILMPESFSEAYIGITEAIESGKLTEERINESLRRIYRVKYAGQAEE